VFAPQYWGAKVSRFWEINLAAAAATVLSGSYGRQKTTISFLKIVRPAVVAGAIFRRFHMAIHRFPPDSDRAQQIVAQRLEKLKKSVPERRTLRKDLEDRREELLSLRAQGLGIVDIAMAYQDILEDLGWPRPSLSYIIKLVSEVTAKGARSGREQIRPGDEAQMGAIIPVFRANIGGVEVDAVKARDLHAFLEVGKMFAHWIQDRIEKFGFVENQDFVIDLPVLANQTGRGGDRRSKEYILTLDMAKELSMVERTPKGKQARQYFIEIERRYYESPPFSWRL